MHVLRRPSLLAIVVSALLRQTTLVSKQHAYFLVFVPAFLHAYGLVVRVVSGKKEDTEVQTAS